MNSIILIKACKGQTIGFENLVGREIQAFRQVLLENETQDVVAETISIHSAPEYVGNVPELLLKLLLLFVGHAAGSSWILQRFYQQSIGLKPSFQAYAGSRAAMTNIL